MMPHSLQVMHLVKEDKEDKYIFAWLIFDNNKFKSPKHMRW